jgi:EAL domain-containing protein (putative c-di-GMP-specific phosphodiesterase class I)
VFREAAEMVARLAVEGFPAIVVGVNVSSRDLEQPDFLTRIERDLAETGAAPAALRLEVTESLLISQPELARLSLEACRAHGLGVAIDDFGTGHSSLTYLHRLPIDTLKLDQGFIRSITSDRAGLLIVRSVLGLAHDLGLATVAEGVENQEEADLLRDLGCLYGQGYLFSAAVSTEEALSLLRQGGRAPP